MKKVLISVFVLSVLFGSLSAAPFQTLGMLRTPDAYVLPHKAGEILLVGYYRDVAKPSTADPDRSKGFYPYGMLSVGLFDKAELGFFGGDKVYYFNAKLKLIEETVKIPQLSVGLDNMLSPVNRHRAQDHTDPSEWSYANHPDKTDYEYWSPYIVASKQVVIGGINWIFSLGAGSNRFTGQVPRSRIFNGTFYSVNFSPMRNLHFQAEYSGHDFQAGVKYDIGKFSVKFAGQALEDLYKTNGYEDNLRLALGVSYLFDKYATSKRMPDLRELAQTDDLILTDGDLVVVDDTTQPKPGDPGTEVADGSLDFSTLPDSDVVLDGGKYDQLSPEIKELMEELTLLREEREKAHKALLELRKWLEEQQDR